MAKHKKKPVQQPGPIAPPVSSLSSRLFSRNSIYEWIIVLCCFALYANTLQNQFALDDGLVLRDNKIVLKGLSGIPDILTHDSFYGAIGNSKNLSGGRYRPLSLVSYAIEISIFGVNPFIHHLINVLLYALTCVVLLKFLLKFIFPQNKNAAIIATLLFAFHPIHTEVVANIKSRDEIFSLLFLLLTLHYLLVYLNESKKFLHYELSLLCYLLALFSKENGLIFVVMIPLTVYFFVKKKWSDVLSVSIWFWVTAIFYMIIRFALLGFSNHVVPGVMDNPYVLATVSQKLASILFVGLMYLKLLFFPYPLTYDYSYHQIPYSEFSSLSVIASLLIYACITAFAFWKWKSRDVISWCIFFFLGSLFLISNLLFNIGAPLAERFLYQASLPFIIAFTEIFRRIFAKQKQFKSLQRTLVIGFLAVVFSVSSYEIFLRNMDWKTDETIFLHDVKISSQSARANTYAGIALIHLCDASKDPQTKKSKASEAIGYFKRSLEIKSDYLPTLLNMGVAYSRIDSGEAAERVWNMARTIEPDNSNFLSYDDYLSKFYFNRGMKEGGERNFAAAVPDLEKAVKYKPDNADGWYNLGGAYFMQKDYPKAKESWETTLKLKPNYPQAQYGLRALLEKTP